MAGSSQKFIARNRAPRVQIEYDVELYGAEKKVQLPFVMGVLSDLSGKSLAEPPAVADRRFLEIDADNFDDRMKAMAPRAAFSVPNTLTGEGQLSVDLTFERMADFTPAAVARKVAPLRALLEARERLAHLATYMDGKVGAEALIERLLANPAALASLAATLPEAAEGETAEALATLRDAMPEDAPEDDGSATLDALRAAAPAEVVATDMAGDVLAGIARVEETAEADRTGDVLAGIERAEEIAEGDSAADVLAGIARAEDAPEVDDRDDVLSRIERREEASDSDEAGDVLGRMERAPDEVPETDGAEDVLAGIARAEDAPEKDDRDDVLSRMERRETAPSADDAGDVLGRMERAPDEVPETDGAGDVLAGIARAEDAEESDQRGDVLAGLERREAAAEADEAGAVLEGLERVPDVPAAGAEAEGILAGVERAGEAPETDDRGDVLAGMQRVEEDDRADDGAEILAGLAEESPKDDGDDLAGLGGEDDAAGAAEDDDLAALMAELEADDASAGGEDDETGADAPIEGLDPAAERDEDVEDPETAALMAELDDDDDREAEDSELAALMAGLDDDAGEGDDDAALSTAEEEGEAAGLLAGDAAEAENDSEEEDAELAALMAGLDEDDEDDGEDPELAALMAGLDVEEGEDEGEAAGLLAGEPEEAEDDSEEDAELAALMAGLDDDDEDDGEDPELAALMAGLDVEEGEDEGEAAGLLAGEPEEAEDDSEEDAELAALMAGLDDDDEDDGEDPELAALMAGLDEDEDEDGGEAAGLLAGDTAEAEDDSEEEDAELAALMAGLDDDDDSEGEEDPELAALMAGLDDDDGEEVEDPDLAALMAGLDDESEGGEDGDAELSALMAGLDGDGDAGEDDELEKLMAGLDDDEGGTGDGELDALMAGLDGDGSGNAEGSGAEAQDLTLSDEAEHAFGTMGAARPEPAKLERQRFRIALFGDFSGRSARGILETGEALAAREGVVLDCDSVEEIIEGFATTLVLPLGKDGQGMEVSLKELDDLHPDELYENLPIFAELKGLRQQLGSAATAQGAAEKLRRWGEEHGVAVRPPQRHSAANTVRADLRLSDFEKLIGASAPAPRATASSVEDLLARVVGPHVRKAQGADAAAMQTAVDEALSAAMRMVLHHPDFQAIEAQWRTLDLIARSIETDDSLEVMLYDLSAEEIAADIAAHDDLSTSGLARLLTEKPLDEENGRGAFSVLIGLYTFEETPPHAELLGRIARIAAHVDAPFVTAITPDFIDTKMEDRHRLVAEAWDTLRAMPEARHLGLVSPRFLLRRPYGEKSEPIYEFDFEEFTMAEGLSGMLWANPAVLPAILMAQSFRKNGMGLQLGSVMSLGGMPYHFVTDRHGDQVALPCTERNFSVDKHTAAVRRGYMPVLSVKGRDEVRLGSFNAVAGEELLGPWSKVPPPPPSPPKPPRPAPAPAAEAEDDDDLAGFGGDSDDDDLDALLAGFNDSSDDDDDGDGDLDAELAALLNDL